jgi:hypothetical protein
MLKNHFLEFAMTLTLVRPCLFGKNKQSHFFGNFFYSIIRWFHFTISEKKINISIVPCLPSIKQKRVLSFHLMTTILNIHLVANNAWGNKIKIFDLCKFRKTGTSIAYNLIKTIWPSRTELITLIQDRTTRTLYCL